MALQTTFIQKTNTFLYPYLALLVLCLLLMLSNSKEALYYTINSHHASFTDTIFTVLTFFGSGLGCIIITLIVTIKNFRQGFLILTSYLIGFVISQMLKNLVKAPRPHLFFAKKLSGIYFVKGVVLLDANSFPSGHSVSAFTMALVFTYLCRNKSWGYFWLILAVLIGYSRLYLSEHFLQDVVAGSVLGVVLTAFWLTYIDKKLFLTRDFWKKGLFFR